MRQGDFVHDRNACCVDVARWIKARGNRVRNSDNASAMCSINVNTITMSYEQPVQFLEQGDLTSEQRQMIPGAMPRDC